MQLNSIARPLRVWTVLISLLILTGCFGEGDGKDRIPGTPLPPPPPPSALIGFLVDGCVAGVTWQTSAGAAGITTNLGEFEYFLGDTVTFSIGDIVLGTVTGAPYISPVELTRSDNPTSQPALNMLVFLQSIDEDGNPDNCITISNAARAAAQGQSLDFTSATFTTQAANVVSAIMGSGRVLVSESDALIHFYSTYASLGGTDTFSFLFPGFAPVGSGDNFKLVFSDEFNQGTAPSEANWTIETGYGPSNNGWGNNEWQLYTTSPDNVRVEDGNLVLSAQCPTAPCGVRDGTITSGKINSLNKFNFKFGKVIARIKPPVGEAAWPAFWALGANHPTVGWPQSGEIDFMEMHNFFSDEKTTHFTLHWCEDSPSANRAPGLCTPPEGWIFDSQNRSFPNSLGDDFHIFEADWDADRMIGKIDGVTVFSRTIDAVNMDEFLKEFYMILNVAMGGTLGSGDQPPNGSETFPQTMLVDYVRVFQKMAAAPADDIVIDFEDAPENYDFGASGGFGGGAAAVIANPVAGGINNSAQVVQMLKFSGEVFAGSKLTLPTTVEVAADSVFTMKVWSSRAVDVLLKLEGTATDPGPEVNITHGGSGWEQMSFNFGSFSGSFDALTFIFDLGIVGDATNDPDNWTFYFDDIRIPQGSGDTGGNPGGVIADFEGAADTYDFGLDGGFGGGASAVIANPVSGGINTSAQVAQMQKFTADVFGGSLLSLPSVLELPIGSKITMKVWSPRAVNVLLKLEGGTPVEINVAHGGTGWEELTYDFSSIASSYTGISIIFDLGIIGDAAGDPDNWTFYFDDITLITASGPPDPVDPDAPIADFEAPAGTYNFGPDGGFGGGATEIIANPVSGGLNTSSQVARMRKFAGEVFAGSLFTLPSTLTVEAGSAFTMLVWSPRAVDVLLKLEGSATTPDPEDNITHGGSGWELLTFNYPNFSGNVTGLSIIFDLGIVGDATNDPDNWTFYFDDIKLVPPGGGGGLAQIKLPITFDDAGTDYTLTDFGMPAAAITTLIADPDNAGNTVASTTKPLGAPVWAGTTMSTTAGFASAIPFSATQTTIGVRVYSPDAGIPVRLKAEDEVDGSISVEAEVMTTKANEWETLVFDFADEVEGTPLNVQASYSALSIFFNFGTDGDTAGTKTYLWDDVVFGVLPMVDAVAPVLSNVSIVSNNANTAYARTGDTITVSLTASEAITMPSIMIGGMASGSVTGSGTNWQATRTLTGADNEGPIGFSVSFEDLAGNTGTAVSVSTDGSSVTLDNTVPTVTIQNAATEFTNLTPLAVTFQFSESVTGFALNDISISNGTVAGLVAVDADTYTANVTPDGNGDLVIAVSGSAVADAAGNLNAMAATITITNAIDVIAPILTLVSVFSDNTNPALAMAGNLVTVSMTASEPINAPMVVIGSLAAGTVTGAGTSWQASRTLTSADAQGAISFAIAFQDLVGNAGALVAMATDGSGVSLDTTAPTVMIQGAPASYTTTNPLTVTFQFSEVVSDFALNDIQTSNGTAAGLVAVDGDTYTAQITPTGGGELAINVASGAATDAAGNASVMATTVNIADGIAPSLSLVSLSSDNAIPTLATNGNVVTLTLTANEVIMAPTVMIAGVPAVSVTGAGNSWQASHTLSGAAADGAITFSVSYTDVAGNTGAVVTTTTDGSSVTLDNTAPTVLIQGAPASFTDLSPINLTFQFSEAVSGFDLSDIQTTNGVKSAFVTVDSLTYTARVTPNGTGDLSIAVAAAGAADLAGNLNQMATTITVMNALDANAPLLTQVSLSSNNANAGYARSGDVVMITMTSNEEITAPTVMIAGLPADSVTGSVTAWQASRTMLATDTEGLVDFVINFQDLGGNAGPQTTATTDSSEVIFDITSPAVSSITAPAAFSDLNPFGITVQFTEAVTGFVGTDIQVTNGTASGFTGAADTYTANITPTGNGDLTIAVGPGAAADLAGNLSLMATDVIVTNNVDASAPVLSVVSITSNNANPAFATTGDVVTVAFTASEAINPPTVTIAGTAADSVTGANTSWQATRTMTSGDVDAVLSFSIAFSDLAGNAGTPVSATTDTSSVTLDSTAPSLAINGAPATFTTLNALVLSFEFTEDVAGFDLTDIAVTNGTAATFAAQSAATYSAEITPDGVGDLIVSVAIDAATDSAGNGSLADSVTVTADLPPAWELVWSDTFDTGPLDLLKWTARTDLDCPAPCSGQQTYLMERVGVAGGVLTISAQEAVGPVYSSGLIDTKGKWEFKHGRVEIDARMPGTRGSAPTLFMLPASDSYGPWPMSGEVDIVNAPDLGVTNKMLEHALQYGLPEPENTTTKFAQDAPSAPDMSFFTYALEWEAGELRWYVDNVHVATQTEDNWYSYSEDADGVFITGTGAAPFDDNFYLALGLAVNANADGMSTFPQTLEIDAVRIYECARSPNPAAGTGCSTANPGVIPLVAADTPYIEQLSIYTDAPETHTYTDQNNMTTAGTLMADTLTSGGGMVISSVTNTADPQGGNFWSVNVSANTGSGAVVLQPGGFTNATGFFDLSGGGTAGELLFRMKVNSISGSPQISAGLQSDMLGSGRVPLTYTANGQWQQYSVKLSDLVTDSVMQGTTLNLARIESVFVLEAAGGTVTLDVDDISVKVACRDTGGCEATPRLIVTPPTLVYSDDFEAADITGSVIGAGWKFFINVFEDGGYLFSYFGAAPNGPQICTIAQNQGGPDQGMQQLNMFSDYDCCGGGGPGGGPSGHQSISTLGLVETTVFREFSLTSGDVGKTYTFNFDAKMGNVELASQAIAFVKVLNPSMGFAQTAIVNIDTSNTPVTWEPYSMDLLIGNWDGQVLQFGFLTNAGRSEGSGVFYDNVELLTTGP